MSKYTPQTLEQKLGWVVEEAGEVCAAIGKTMRWGPESWNPELTPNDKRFGETNREWVLREMDDLKKAIALLEEAFEKGKR